MELVILVDQNDNEEGVLEKMEAHKLGVLHRAFSVFIFNSEGEMLLQQRAAAKYHSPNLWTNACCSHPKPGERTASAAERRLQEELGFSVPLEHLFSFVYKANLDNGLIEHEYDHVFTGIYEGPFQPEISEVQDHEFVSVACIKQDLEVNPDKYTAWFRLAFPRLLQTDYLHRLQLT